MAMNTNARDRSKDPRQPEKWEFFFYFRELPVKIDQRWKWRRAIKFSKRSRNLKEEEPLEAEIIDLIDYL